MVTVKLNKGAGETLTEAEQAGAAAVDLAANKRFRDAQKKFDAAKDLFGAVPAQSVFAARAREEAAALRTQAYALMLAEVKARMGSSAPEWSSVIEFIAHIEDLTDRAEQRVELQRMRAECQTNMRDEQLYQRAVDIVGVRDVDRYPEALRLLGQIDQRSRIHPDAQAYVQWIDADLKVRQAQRAYQQGDERRAFALLTAALQHEVLGPEARNSVRQRRQNWSRVVTAYTRGMQLFNSGQRAQAQEEFERVIQFEPDRNNRYNRNALQQIQHIARMKNLDLDRKLREGLEDLASNDFEGAYRFFGEVHRDPNRQQRHLQMIAEAVVDANRSRRLLATCQREFTADKREAFLKIYYVTKLLRRWLPADDRDRPDAEKLYENVLKRLKILEQISELDTQDD
jgi:tetratricopeptide (TPR) repeat protein